MYLCRMEIQTVKANKNEKVGFLDPGMVNETLISREADRKDIEDYVLDTLLKLQNKHYVFLPYSFEYVFPCLVVFIFSCSAVTICHMFGLHDIYVDSTGSSL